ncbi:MAG: hypothetical protein HPY52_10640 [Firmicutes bacterium]|nr:hypothetical protein [Bacillota bacterium]
MRKRLGAIVKRNRVLDYLADGEWHTLPKGLAEVAGRMASEGLLERKQGYIAKGKGCGMRVLFRLPKAGNANGNVGGARNGQKAELG